MAMNNSLKMNQRFSVHRQIVHQLHGGFTVESSWNVMAHGDAREGKWRGNWWMEWVDGTLHTTSEHGVSSVTTADARTSAGSSGLKRRPCRFKWTRPFLWKTKSGFCACAITFQTQSTFQAFRLGSGLTLNAAFRGFLLKPTHNWLKVT